MAARPPATHQDAFEEVALLGRQLHVRHRGRREAGCLGAPFCGGGQWGGGLVHWPRLGLGSQRRLSDRSRSGKGRNSRRTLAPALLSGSGGGSAPGKMAARDRPLERGGVRLRVRVRGAGRQGRLGGG